MRKLSKLCYTVVVKTLHRYLENDAVRLQTAPTGGRKNATPVLEERRVPARGGLNQDLQAS